MGEKLSEDNGLPPNLRFLRVLVTVLTAVMILGVLTIVALLVIRLGDSGQTVLVHPEVFAIPEGVNTVGYSIHEGLVIIVGDDHVIRVFEAGNHALVQEIQLPQ